MIVTWENEYHEFSYMTSLEDRVVFTGCWEDFYEWDSCGSYREDCGSTYSFVPSWVSLLYAQEVVR